MSRKVVIRKPLQPARASDLAGVLRGSERRYRALIDNLDGWVYRCRNDRHWTMELVSAGVQHQIGYRPVELTSGAVHHGDLVHPGDADRVWDEVQEAIAACRSSVVSLTVRAERLSGIASKA